MRRALLFAVPVLALALTGCPSKPKDGTCKTSEDCADQEGFGKVCVEGRCQECGQDTDCKAGCSTDADCGAGRACEDGKCVTRAAAAVAGCPTDGKYETINFDFDKAL